MSFVPEWRARASAAFDLAANSTAGRTVALDLWGRRHEVYANANLSIYSAQRCNARCRFCVEELRPASRGGALASQRRVEPDDGRWFAALDATLDAVRPLDPSVSVTGGEPSHDPRLPRLLRHLAARGVRKRTLTTNGSGLLDVREGRAVVDWVSDTGVRHLNVSVAHPDPDRNAALMRYRAAPADLATLVARARPARLRLSCVLARGGVDDLAGVVTYLRWAAERGVDNVVFRQLMGVDPATASTDPVVAWSEAHRVSLAALLAEVGDDGRFTFVRQVVGYYYYVEVWRFAGIDVVFEEADLARLEAVKATSGVVHELVFHPEARLCSTWQPWDGVLGPPERSGGPS